MLLAQIIVATLHSHLEHLFFLHTISSFVNTGPDLSQHKLILNTQHSTGPMGAAQPSAVEFKNQPDSSYFHLMFLRAQKKFNDLH